LTVRVTVKVPGDEYVWVMDDPVPVDPSPKAQLKVYGVVPPVADPENVTCWPTCGDEGE